MSINRRLLKIYILKNAPPYLFLGKPLLASEFFSKGIWNCLGLLQRFTKNFSMNTVKYDLFKKLIVSFESYSSKVKSLINSTMTKTSRKGGLTYRKVFVEHIFSIFMQGRTYVDFNDVCTNVGSNFRQSLQSPSQHLSEIVEYVSYFAVVVVQVKAIQFKKNLIYSECFCWQIRNLRFRIDDVLPRYTCFYNERGSEKRISFSC